jgi:hypothetical protein
MLLNRGKTAISTANTKMRVPPGFGQMNFIDS